MAQLDEWIPKLAALPSAERAALRGVSRPRSKQILAGALVARHTMAALGVDAVDLCPWALREGIMLRHLQRIDDTLPFPLVSATLTREPLHSVSRRPAATISAAGGS